MKSTFDRLRWPVTFIVCTMLLTLAPARATTGPSLDRVTSGFVIYPDAAPTTITTNTSTATCATLTAAGYYEVNVTTTSHCRQTAATGTDTATTTDNLYSNPVPKYIFTGNGLNVLCCIADASAGTVYLAGPLSF